jgi:hypothetical protein
VKDRDYLLPLFAVAIGVFFIAVLVTGIVFWNRMPVMVSAPPPSATTTPVVATPPPTPTPTLIPPPTLTAETPPTLRPRGTASVGAPSESEIPNAEAAVARLRSGFRRCYNRGLETNPSLEGSITLTITVNAAGDVMSVTKTGSIDPTVDDCIVRVARAAYFDSSRSGGKVSVPVRFARVR